MSKQDLIALDVIEESILLIRGQKVIVDRDLARLYGVETKYLNRQVRRNMERFPKEFMFQLSSQEKNELVTDCHRFNSLKHSSVLPYVFTEHGVAMMASVLNSDRAVKVSVYIIKVFVKLRQMLSTYKELAVQLEELERKVGSHDRQIAVLFEAIRKLMAPPPEKTKRPIGFIVDREYHET